MASHFPNHIPDDLDQALRARFDIRLTRAQIGRMTNNNDLSIRARAALPGGSGHELRYRILILSLLTTPKGRKSGWDDRHIDFKMGSASQMWAIAIRSSSSNHQAERSVFSADCHEAEIIWAEWVNRLFPSAERTRFTLRGPGDHVAYGWGGHGRARILLRLEGHYHG